MHLSKGTTLQKGKYRIESVLGQGSFGITYLATTRFQGALGGIDVKVAIKEFFARDLNMRHPDGKTVSETSSGSISGKYAKDFQREARNLASLKHPCIINVLESFSENNTHYYAMEYIDGGSLDEYIISRGRLEESETQDIARQIASALSYMHSCKMLHLDLKPKNIMHCSDGTVKLIDFGLSKQYESNGEPESSTSIGLGTQGYAPLEQGNGDERKNFAPTLDIYALGATMYKMLTGKTPPRASDIMNDGFPEDRLVSIGVSKVTTSLIASMMAPRKKDRPQTLIGLIPSSDEETIVTVTKGKKYPRWWCWGLTVSVAMSVIYTLADEGISTGSETIPVICMIITAISCAFMIKRHKAAWWCTSIGIAATTLFAQFYWGIGELCILNTIILLAHSIIYFLYHRDSFKYKYLYLIGTSALLAVIISFSLSFDNRWDDVLEYIGLDWDYEHVNDDSEKEKIRNRARELEEQYFGTYHGERMGL